MAKISDGWMVWTCPVCGEEHVGVDDFSDDADDNGEVCSDCGTFVIFGEPADPQYGAHAPFDMELEINNVI